MSWSPNPNAMPADPTFVTVAIPDSLHTRFEQACDVISQAQPEGDDRAPEDIIVALGLRAAESLIHTGQVSQLFPEQGEHDDRP